MNHVLYVRHYQTLEGGKKMRQSPSYMLNFNKWSDNGIGFQKQNKCELLLIIRMISYWPRE